MPRIRPDRHPARGLEPAVARGEQRLGGANEGAGGRVGSRVADGVAGRGEAAGGEEEDPGSCAGADEGGCFDDAVVGGTGVVEEGDGAALRCQAV